MKYVKDIVVTHTHLGPRRPESGRLTNATFVIIVFEIFVHGVPQLVLSVNTVSVAGGDTSGLVVFEINIGGIHWGGDRIVPINTFTASEKEVSHGCPCVVNPGEIDIIPGTLHSIAGFDGRITGDDRGIVGLSLSEYANTLVGKTYPTPQPGETGRSGDLEMFREAAHVAEAASSITLRRIRGEGGASAGGKITGGWTPENPSSTSTVGSVGVRFR